MTGKSEYLSATLASKCFRLSIRLLGVISFGLEYQVGMYNLSN